ncbi:glycosyltransferase family 39 protein [bacterium]|nr:glycosyltransferase family 39 protein [bacterium]
MKTKIFNLSNLYWLIIVAIIIVFHGNHILENDEGVVLEGAWNLINNRELYIDFFEIVTPGVFYLIFWLWKIFGVSYLAANIVSMAALFLGAVGIYKISQQIISSSLNKLGPLFFVLSSAYWSVIIYHNFNICFMIWATYFFLRALNNNKYKYFIASGLLTGLSILFMQNKGLILFGALASFLLILLIKKRKKIYLHLGLCYSLFSLLPILILFLKWSPAFLYNKLIYFPLTHYFGLPGLSYKLVLLFVILILIAIHLFYKEKSCLAHDETMKQMARRAKKIWLLIYLQGFLLISTLPLPDHFHTTLVLFPLIALSALLGHKIIKTKIYYQILYGPFILASIIVILFPAMIFTKNFKLFVSETNHPVLLYIKNNCQDSKYLYAGPYMSIIYFESRQLNATPYSWLITNHHSPEQFLDARQYLKKNKPSCAILEYTGVAKYNYNKNNPLDNYILDNYYLEENIGNVLIYKINDLSASK